MDLLRLAAALMFAGLATTAQAGDGAGLDVYGFSPDGARFVFEQSGSEDGSAFPFSEIAVIDTQTGGNVDGSPFRSRIETENADIEDARQAAAHQAKAVFDGGRIGRDGMAFALNAAIRPSEELLPMDIWPIQKHEVQELALPSSKFGAGKIRIEQRTATSAHCQALAEGRAKALKLTLVRDDGQATTLHDGDLPDERGCPTFYGVAGVYLHPRAGGGFALVVMVSAYPLGFEGPDRRFIAFATRLAGPG